MVTVYLIRHGEAEGNLYRRMQGQYNGDLTDLGRRQIEALGRRFQNVRLDAVYSSDLSRAMETGAVLCRPRGLPLRTDPRLREVCVGPWEDLPFGNAAADQPAQFQQFIRDPNLWKLEGADTFAGLSDRGWAALKDIIARHEGQTVAVCAHQVIIKSLLCKLCFGLDHPEQVAYGTNTAVSRFTAEGGRLTLDFQNDVSHLDDSLLRIPTHRDLAIRPMAGDAVEEYIRYRKDAWQVVYGTLKGFDGSGFWLDARRTVGPDPEFLGLMPDYLEGITLRSLAVICADIDAHRETFLLESEHIAPKRLPIALTVASVDRLARSRGHLTFSELLDGSSEPEVVVATFLAVLDLYHRDKLRMRQERNFGEIELDHVEGATPYEMDESVIYELEEQGVDEQDLEELGFGDVLVADEDEGAQADDSGEDA